MDTPKGYEWIEVSMKFDADVNEMVRLLKKKYRKRRMSDALRQFIKDYEPEIYEDGQKIAQIHGHLVKSKT